MSAGGWEFRGARPSRALAVASRHCGLPEDMQISRKPFGGGSSSQRDAATSARDGRAPRNSRPQISREEVRS